MPRNALLMVSKSSEDPELNNYIPRNVFLLFRGPDKRFLGAIIY